jgi:hypothetical protein
LYAVVELASGRGVCITADMMELIETMVGDGMKKDKL